MRPLRNAGIFGQPSDYFAYALINEPKKQLTSTKSLKDILWSFEKNFRQKIEIKYIVKGGYFFQKRKILQNNLSVTK